MCVQPRGIIHDRMPGMDDLTTERNLRGSLMCLAYSILTCNPLVVVQPDTGRRPVDWCKNKLSVLYMRKTLKWPHRNLIRLTITQELRVILQNISMRVVDNVLNDISPLTIPLTLFLPAKFHEMCQTAFCCCER